MLYVKSGLPIQTTGDNLVGLWRPSFVKVDYRLFVYGGGGNVTNDLHVLHLNDMRWETIKTVKGKAPCKRYGHTATLWNNYIVVFGGCNEIQEYCNDVHIFDTKTMTWFQPEINGIVVPARYLHSASVYDDKLFVYGGFAKNPECTYVLDELCVLDLKTFRWSKYIGVPPRYNHSATLIGHKMYIYAGKDEHGNTISDLFVVNLNTPPYKPHLVLSGSTNSQMVLLKSQHFCEAVCGKLLVFGRYLTSSPNNDTTTMTMTNANVDSMYGLWMLDIDTLEWKRQDCSTSFVKGGWNYFTTLTENIQSMDEHSPVALNNLFFLGNTDSDRPQGYDHFRDALIINGESLGLYDIPPLRYSSEFSRLLNNPELSDFIIVPSNGQELHVHQIILIARWPHFRNIYQSGMMEVQQKRMDIPEPYEVVLAFLKYLYNDRLDDDEPWPIVCNVLALANIYLLNRLKKICCERLYRKHMSIESCGLIFEKAIRSEEEGLKLLTLDFMFRNYGSVLKSNVLLQMPPLIRQEFLEAVPDEAVLEVNRNRLHHSTTLTSINSPLSTKAIMQHNNINSINTTITNNHNNNNNPNLLHTSLSSSTVSSATPSMNPHSYNHHSHHQIQQQQQQQQQQLQQQQQQQQQQQHHHHHHHHLATNSLSSSSSSSSSSSASSSSSTIIQSNAPDGIPSSSSSSQPNYAMLSFSYDHHHHHPSAATTDGNNNLVQFRNPINQVQPNNSDIMSSSTINSSNGGGGMSVGV